jgi:Arc/MetJ-type ribon-helix-helix transcriptional regulator
VVDGDVVAAVEAQRDKGRNVTASRYIRVAVREMLANARREPSLTLHLPRPRARSRRALRIRLQLEPVDLCQHQAGVDEPDHTFETGLGVFATTSMNVWANLRLVRQMLSKSPRSAPNT